MTHVAQLTLRGDSILFPPTRCAESPDADWIQRLASSATSPRSSEVLGSKYWALAETLDQASLPNWDGYGALAVRPETFQKARAFLEMLPTTIPQPDIGADPDGEIVFEWQLKPDVVLSVSIGPADRLNYAALFGENRVYGTESFANGLPEAIASNLARCLSSQ